MLVKFFPFRRLRGGSRIHGTTLFLVAGAVENERIDFLRVQRVSPRPINPLAFSNTREKILPLPGERAGVRASVPQIKLSKNMEIQFVVSRPHPNPLPQERGQRRRRTGFPNDRVANPHLGISSFQTQSAAENERIDCLRV